MRITFYRHNDYKGGGLAGASAMGTMTGALLLLMAGAATAQFAVEGHQFSLECTSTAEVQYWMINGIGKAFRTGEVYEEESIEVFANGTILFEDVKTEYEGDHLCVTKVQEEITGHPVSMQVRPRPSTDPWNDSYKGQFITGLISALICAFLFTAGCLVFKYRYREPKPVALITEEGGHYNQALEIDVDAKGHSTKM